MGFGEAVRTVFGKYATFRGRARRAEYWWWALFVILVSIVLSVADSVLFGTVTRTPGGFEAQTDTPWLSMLFMLVTFLPGLAVTVRRLHDTDHSGWWLLAPYGTAFAGAFSYGLGLDILGAVGVIGMIATTVLLLVWMVRRGTPGTNRFGPDPLEGSGGTDGGGHGGTGTGSQSNPIEVPTVIRRR